MTSSKKIILPIAIFTLISSIPLMAQYNVYWGNLHSHTSYSDGEGTPEQAFAYARDVAGIDFLAVTDHLEQIYYLEFRWDDTRTQADAATEDGVFVGFAGYEWGSPLYNHCNVFNTPNMLSPLTYFDWPDFTDDLVGATPAMGQFNHPEDEEYPLLWNYFAYVGPEVDSAFRLIEIKNDDADSFYAIALDSGWHVSAVANQDNHEADWGNKNDRRAGIWATELTRSALIDAIRKKRTFSTQDKNVSCWIDLDGIDMGSFIPRNYSMRLHITLEDADFETLSTIIVRGGNRIVFSTMDNIPTPFDTTLQITPYISDWVYVYAQQTDGERIWSGPIFITGAPLSIVENGVIDRTFSLSPNPASMRLQFAGVKIINAEPEFYDISGRSVSSLIKKINDNSFDISVLPVGTYIIRLGNYSEKIVVLR